MNDDMLRNIDYLREKADVSYEEAANLLERYDGNVMRVLVELEQQGRIYTQPTGNSAAQDTRRQQDQFDANEVKEKAKTFVDKAFKTRLVVEKKGENGGTETVANLSAPFAAGAAVVAPWLAVAAAGVAFVTGHNVKIEKADSDETETK